MVKDEDIKVILDPVSYTHLAQQAYDPQYGARPVKRYLQKYVETEIASMIIRGDLSDGDRVVIESTGEKLTFRPQQMLKEV